MSEPETLRERLRNATTDLHGQVDAAMELGEGAMDAPRYQRFLRCMDSLMGRFGGALERTSQAAKLEDCSHALGSALAVDLQALGKPFSSRAQTARGASLACSRDWGIAYALEGSAMGSRLVLRNVRSQLGHNVPVHYLEASAAGAVGRWPKFLAALEGAEVEPDLAIDGARSVFEHLLTTLTADRAGKPA